MHRYFLSVLLIFFTVSSVFAQNKSETLNFPVVIKFESVCCGVPNDAPMKKYLKNFKEKNNMPNIQGSYIGPMGREGEYYIGFSLSEMKAVQQTSFIKGLKSVASKMRDKGQAVVEKDFSINKSDLSERTVIKDIQY